MKYIARAGGLMGFPDLVRERGQNPSRLLRDAGLSIATLHDPDLYLPYLSITKLLQRAAKVCGDEHFGLHLGSRQGLEVIGALGAFLSLQTNLAEALTVIKKNLGFHSRGLALDSEIRGKTIDLTMRYVFDNQTDCTQLSVKGMAVTARSIAQLHGRAMSPLEVALVIAAPARSEPYETFFGCPVQFGAATNHLRFPTDILTLPVAVAPDLRNRLTERWRGDWQQAEAVASLSQQVERAIVALLPTGDFALETVASLLMLHPRSLQQQLKREGTQYGEILQKARQHLACQHLERSDVELTQLALDLGFAELAVFSRAFKVWCGVPPSAWRRERLSRAESVPIRV